MRLLERELVLARLSALLRKASAGEGRLVLLAGEAGIGKTSVVKAFAHAHQDTAHLLRGECDDLMTPRPLGPVWDMVSDEPSLASTLNEGDRYSVFEALNNLLTRSIRPTLMVIDDVHWADEVTLDLIRYLGRRMDKTHALLVLTLRDPGTAVDHPLWAALGELRQHAIERISLERLSPQAVSELVDDQDDAARIWEISGGNPFFVTELIRSDVDAVPLSVRDTVRSRLLHLSDAARDLVELASVAPGRIELPLVFDILGENANTVAESERAGILEVSGGAVNFRHELARRAVEEDLAEARRRELNSRVLQALEARGESISRLAHHARQAHDAGAMLRILPRAAHQASRIEAHREAVSHLRALQPHLDEMNIEDMADHYHFWAYEEFLVDPAKGDELIEKAVNLRRQVGDWVALGNTLTLAARIAQINSRGAAAVEFSDEAAALLEPVGGEDLAMAYVTGSTVAMIQSNNEKALRHADLALAHAGSDPGPARAHALVNKGTLAFYSDGYEAGLAQTAEGYSMAVDHGYFDVQERAAGNLAALSHLFRRPDEGTIWVGRALELEDRRQIPRSESYAFAVSAALDEMRGNWDDAEAKTRSLLAHASASDNTRVVAAATLGRVLLRRGDPHATELVFEAWDRARTTQELQRLALNGALVAEHAWLKGINDERLIERLGVIVDRGVQLNVHALVGELAQWLALLGVLQEVPARALDPFLLLPRGCWREAADFWEEREIPYERAVALAHGEIDAKILALGILDKLGARPLAARIRAELRNAGVTGIPRGPWQATRGSPLGLTPRQTEILELLDEGLANVEIANRLVLSVRTVEHHVSAILAQLGARNRAEAVRLAREADS